MFVCSSSFLLLLFSSFSSFFLQKIGDDDEDHRGVEVELGGTKSDSASYELVVTRMRFMGAQRKSQVNRCQRYI